MIGSRKHESFYASGVSPHNMHVQQPCFDIDEVVRNMFRNRL